MTIAGTVARIRGLLASGRHRLSGMLDPAERLRARVAARKARAAATGRLHDDAPRISFVLLSFNHRRNIAPILERLRTAAPCEIIVCEDGSVDGSRDEWLRRLDGPNEFLIASNDLHEIRSYNRAVGLARGDLVCCLQDDDIPPDDGRWVADALELFDRRPRLAILGGHQGYVLDLDGHLDRMRARRIVGFNAGEEWAHVEPIPYRDPVSGVPLMFIEGVSFSPVFFRRNVFLALGGLDLGFSQPGEPGILADHEICVRAWLAGWQVAVYGPPPFRKYVGGQGTLMFGRKARWRNLRDNARRIQRQYADRVASIRSATEQLNAELNSPDSTNERQPAVAGSARPAMP